MKVIVDLKNHKPGPKPKSKQTFNVKFRNRYQTDEEFRQHRIKLAAEWRKNHPLRCRLAEERWRKANPEKVMLNRKRAYIKQQLAEKGIVKGLIEVRQDRKQANIKIKGEVNE